MTTQDSSGLDDPGLAALVAILRFQGVGAEHQQIRHRLGGVRVGVPEMLRCAKELGLKARVRTSTWERLTTTPMPAIAPLRDGGFLLIGRAGPDRVMVQSPQSPRPALMSR